MSCDKNCLNCELPECVHDRKTRGKGANNKGPDKGDQNKYYEAHKEEIKARQHERYQKNRERILEYQRQYRKKNQNYIKK